MTSYEYESRGPGQGVVGAWVGLPSVGVLGEGMGGGLGLGYDTWPTLHVLHDQRDIPQ